MSRGVPRPRLRVADARREADEDLGELDALLRAVRRQHVGAEVIDSPVELPQLRVGVVLDVTSRDLPIALIPVDVGLDHGESPVPEQLLVEDRLDALLEREAVREFGARSVMPPGPTSTWLGANK